MSINIDCSTLFKENVANTIFYKDLISVMHNRGRCLKLFNALKLVSFLSSGNEMLIWDISKAFYFSDEL